MEGRPVSLRIGGQSYRVISSASEDVLERLVRVVNAKIEELSPRGALASPQAVVLAALALAHDLEEERARRSALEARTREVLGRVVGHIDDALACTPDP